MKNSIKTLFIYVMIVSNLMISVVYAAFDGNYIFQLESATQTTISAIVTPQQGMMVYNTTDNQVYYYDGSTWTIASSSTLFSNDGQLLANRLVDLNNYNLAFINGDIGIKTIAPTATLDVNGSFRLSGIYYDKNGDAGTNGQVLSSTSTSTDWISVIPTPYILNSTEHMIPLNTKAFTIDGSNFQLTSIVTIPGFDGTINSFTVISPTQIDINITSGAATADYDIVVTTNGVANTAWVGNGVNLLSVAPSNWRDLRLGGDVFTSGTTAGQNIRYRTGMNLLRDVNGMYFTGLDPWGSWVKFESLGWTRGTTQTIEWIFTRPDNFMMIGIGSTATNETSNSQWNQAETQAYFQSSSLLWGLYGNNGTPGNFGNQANNVSLASCASNVFKLRFTNDGSVGGQTTLYCLPSALQNDWDDIGTVMTTFVIGGTLNPGQANIMPFIIPRNGGTQRFIAVRVQ